VLIDLDDIQ